MTDPDPIDVHVGSVMRRSRAMRGLSLDRLGTLIGVTYQQVQKYETGSNRVSASTLYRIANTLDMSVGDFFPGPDDDSTAQAISSAEDFRACYALERIEDERVRATLRRLIDQLACPIAE